jgi:uncharacterized caspase-like protein
MMRVWTVAVWLLVGIATAHVAHAAERVALVIGNGAYKWVPKLANPPSDAHAIAALLESVGFDVVEGIDLSRDAMSARLLDFGKRAKGADIAVLYYAGQGIALDGASYVLPVDADIKSAADIKLGAAVNVDDALDQTMTDARVKLVFLDMSRTNPFVARLTADRRLSVQTGLAEMKSSEGTLFAFATGPGQSALDGPKGGHSPFTQALLEHVAQPGVEIQEAMRLVRAQVAERTNKDQLPWGHSNLLAPVYLNPKPEPSVGK